MYYSSNSIEEVLKCSQCRLKFTDVVKLIPECGHSICGQCHSSAKDPSKQTNEIKCRTCNRVIVISGNGLPDNKTVMEVLKLQPQEKALTPTSQSLKKLIGEVELKLAELRTFDEQARIQTYCDQLEHTVQKAVEELLAHAKLLANSLLKQINEYRKSQLSSARNPSKRIRMSNEAESADVDQKMVDLSKEIDELAQKWKQHFADISKAESEDDVEDAKEVFLRHRDRLDELKFEIVNKAFNRRFMRFRINESTLRSTKFLGEFIYENTIEGDVAKGEKLGLKSLFSNNMV